MAGRGKQTSEQPLRNQIDQHFAVLTVEIRTPRRVKRNMSAAARECGTSRSRTDSAGASTSIPLSDCRAARDTAGLAAVHHNRNSQRCGAGLTDELTGVRTGGGAGDSPDNAPIPLLPPRARLTSSLQSYHDPSVHATVSAEWSRTGSGCTASTEYFGDRGDEFLIVLPMHTSIAHVLPRACVRTSVRRISASRPSCWR